MMDTNYLCEQKLKRENPQLHKRVADQECRKVIRERTPYRIAQREILIQPYNGLFFGQAEMDRLAVQGKLYRQWRSL